MFDPDNLNFIRKKDVSKTLQYHNLGQDNRVKQHKPKKYKSWRYDLMTIQKVISK